MSQSEMRRSTKRTKVAFIVVCIAFVVSAWLAWVEIGSAGRRFFLQRELQRRAERSNVTASLKQVLNNVAYWFEAPHDGIPPPGSIMYSGRLGEWHVSSIRVPFSSLKSMETALNSTNQEVPRCWQEPGETAFVSRKVPPESGDGPAWNDYRIIGMVPVWHAIHERSPARLKKAIDVAESDVVPPD